MATGFKSSMVKKCSTLKWVIKSGFETQTDIKLTKFLPFDLNMAADILTFACASGCRP